MSVSNLLGWFKSGDNRPLTNSTLLQEKKAPQFIAKGPSILEKTARFIRTIAIVGALVFIILNAPIVSAQEKELKICLKYMQEGYPCGSMYFWPENGCQSLGSTTDTNARCDYNLCWPHSLSEKYCWTDKTCWNGPIIENRTTQKWCPSKL